MTDEMIALTGFEREALLEAYKKEIARQASVSVFRTEEGMKHIRLILERMEVLGDLKCVGYQLTGW